MKRNFETAQELMAATNAAIEAYLAEIDDHPPEALNASDLGCRTVNFCVDDRGAWWTEVVIEEASPNCIAFNDFVTARLKAAGYKNVHSVTEW